MMSGSTFDSSYANSVPQRPQPACTSSTMNSSLCLSASARSPCMNSRVAGTTPLSPCTGSSMMPTVLSLISASTEARSLSWAFGKPGTCGAKIVSQPALPDALMVASVRPWKLWSIVMIS